MISFKKFFAIIFLSFSFFGIVIGADKALLVPNINIGNFVGSDLIALLTEFKNIKLDGGIFESSLFLSLKDFGTEIKPQPLGRSNPFLKATGEVEKISVLNSTTTESVKKSTE